MPTPAVAALVDDLAGVPGVVAVSLGGSRATGTADAGSDTDLGVLYDADALHLDGLAAVCAAHGGRLAGPGGWGQWVDGGAWLTVDGGAVDVILRDMARVREQVERAVTGRFSLHAQPGHPFGFLDVAYAGELASAVPLADAEGVLAALKERLTPYPSALRAAMIAALWQVDFELDGARKGARRGDSAYVALCLATSVMRIAHAWHAEAGAWALNEKGLVARVATLPVDSGGFSASAAAALAAPGATPDELLAAIARVQALPRPSA